ncbi:FlgB family protein [uncultured Lentibacter sp.]|uniref:FlgB family protein n=1 Tax=uncultured Lentibacter sp. TaxID=1659309 RepID=UPI0026132E45|nr:FlgB family protein [uncultured Lentibacter sp.]
MLETLTVFKAAYAMARHAGARQAVLAQNIANADTPKYRARDIAPFSLAPKAQDRGADMIATRAAHLSGVASQADLPVSEARDRSSDPNKNNVSLQEEMLNAVEAKRQHDRAIAIYKSGLNVLRSSLSGK